LQEEKSKRVQNFLRTQIYVGGVFSLERFKEIADDGWEEIKDVVDEGGVGEVKAGVEGVGRKAEVLTAVSSKSLSGDKDFGGVKDKSDRVVGVAKRRRSI
jgi:hypothetical protein